MEKLLDIDERQIQFCLFLMAIKTKLNSKRTYSSTRYLNVIEKSLKITICKLMYLLTLFKSTYRTLRHNTSLNKISQFALCIKNAGSVIFDR